MFRRRVYAGPMLTWVRSLVVRRSLPRCRQCRALLERHGFCDRECEQAYYDATDL